MIQRGGNTMRRRSRMRSVTTAAITLGVTAAVALAGAGGAQAAASRAGAAPGVAAQAAAAAARPGTAQGHAAAAPLAWHNLRLRNGWKSASALHLSYGKPGYAIRDGVVYLKGAIKQPASGSSQFAVLPKGARPAHALYLQVATGTGSDTAVPGTLLIYPGGQMEAYNGGATAFTSLGMVSFPLKSVRAHSLALAAGWKSGQGTYGTGAPAYAISHGVVYISGSLIATSGTPPTVAATVPAAARPKHTLRMTVYTVGGSTGFLLITPSGDLDVYGSEIAGYVSLAGISYPVKSTRWHALRLDSTWEPASSGLGAGHPAYAEISGVVYLTGGASQPPGPGDGLLAGLPKSARTKHTITALTYSGDENYGILSATSDLLLASSNPFSIDQDFTSLSGLSYPAGG